MLIDIWIQLEPQIYAAAKDTQMRQL